MFAKYKKVIGWSLINQALSMLVGFISISLINQLFSKELYGEFVFFQSIFAYILILATLGFDKTIVYKLSHYSESKEKLIGKSLVSFTQKYSFLLLMLIEFLFISIWCLFVDKDFSNEWFWIVLFSINAFLSITITLYSAYFQANKFADTTMKIQVVNNTLKMLILVVLFLLDVDSLVYFVSYIIIPTTFSLILYTIFDRKYCTVEPTTIHKPTKEDLSYSVKMMFTKFVHEGVEKIDLIMVGIFLSASSVAEYAVAAKLAIFVLFGRQLIAPLLSPRLKYSIENKDEFQIVKEYNYYKYLVTIIGLFFIGLFSIFGKEFLSIFGEYEQNYGVLLLLSLAFINHNIFGPNGTLLMLKGYASLTLLSTLLTLLVILILNYFLIPSFGVDGAAFGTFLAFLILNILLEIYISKRIKIKFNSIVEYLIIAFVNLFILALVYYNSQQLIT